MWMLALLAALVLALLAGMRGGGAVEEARSPEQEEQRDVAGSPLAVSARQPGATRAGAARPWQSTSLRPADAGDRLPSLAEGFERADDLHAYLQRLLPAAHAGDAEAAWFVSRVYDYCAAHAADPAGYARDTDALARMGLAGSASMVAARERVAGRCRQFVPADGLGAGLVIVKRLEAAEAGSLAAEASLLAMGEPLEDDAGYRSALVERVRDSADAEAFSALAPAMGLAASGDPAHAGQVAGTRQTELAWQLAACRLGMDCSAQGALMTAWCAHGGVCPPGANQDFEAALHAADPPQGGAETIKQLSDSLLGEGVLR